MTEEEIMMRSGMIQPQPVVQTQQPNLFAQQKAANYPNSENLAQFGKETNKMAQKYAPMLIGQQPKTNEQVVTDRALQQTQNFNAPSTYKAPEPTKQVVNASDPNAGMEALLYTSPEEEERLRKASVQRQRIMAIGDALRHIGNIYNTVNYAPSQQFNNPVEDERRRYLQEKAYRDQNNYKYMTFQQAKAAQDARIRQAEAQLKYNMEKDARDYELRKNESDARANLREAQMHRYETLRALDEAKKQGILSDNEWKKRRAELYPELTRSQIDRNNRTGGGRGGRGGSGGSNMPDYNVVTTYERDDEGRVKSSQKTRTVKHTDGTTSTSTKTSQPQKTNQPKKIGLKGGSNQSSNGKKIGLKK